MAESQDAPIVTRHIGTMSQAEIDVAMIRETLNNYRNEGFWMGDSFGALTRLEEALEREKL